MEPLEEIRDRLARLEDPVALLLGLFAYAPVGFQIYEASGRSLAVNQAFRDLFGAEPPPEYNVLRDEIAERSGALDLIHRAFAGETVNVPALWYDPRELTQVTVETGNRVAVSATFFPIRDREGRVTHVAIVFKDLTAEMLAREQAERERDVNAQLYREAQELHRLRDEFLATVSHELRTPLQAILGWSRLLLESPLGPEDVRRGLGSIERNARAQARLVEQILDASKLVTGGMQLRWQTADLAAIARRVLEGLAVTAEAKRIALDARLPAGPALVRGDPERLQQVLFNLAGNGLKFTPAGGTVTVTLGTHGDQHVLRVADTGQGIPPEFLPHVFSRFRQADSSTTRTHGGVGLGLAVSRHLAELHGGSLQAESAGLDRGATFTLRLPRVEAGAAAEAPAPPAARRTGAARPRLDGLRVLVVDDEPDARDLLHTVLSRQGAAVTGAASAAEAFAQLTAQPPDVLVSDIGMPGEDGFGLLARVRRLDAAHGGQVPAVALTAYTQEEDRQRALAAGFDVHVPKPVDPDQLVAVVADVAGR
jgi:signal transduction histidine kinase/CheY-like chemotaxis protein